MKITKRQLKRIIREEYSRLKRRGLIKESIPINDGKKETPRPAEVEEWALTKGMDCRDYRGWPYPTICEITHPDNPDLFFSVSAHTNRNNYIKLSVFEYTDEKPRGNPPEYHIKEKHLHSIQELELEFEGFGSGSMFVDGFYK